MNAARRKRSERIRSAVLEQVGHRPYGEIAASLNITKSVVCGIVFRSGLTRKRPRSERALAAEREDEALFLANLRDGLARRPSLYLSIPE